MSTTSKKSTTKSKSSKSKIPKSLELKPKFSFVKSDLHGCSRDASAGLQIWNESPEYCHDRPVIHCVHVTNETDIPVCCYCHKEIPLPPQSAWVHISLVEAYGEIVRRRARCGMSPLIIDGRVITESPCYGSTIHGVNTVDSKSGIIRLYGWTIEFPKEVRRVLNENIQNLKTGKIHSEFRDEAIREIERQVSLLPKEDTETLIEKRKNIITGDYLRKVAALKKRYQEKKKGGAE
jgi:hypothetical protein